ncbi:hypothetical protein PR048_029466 [Dryococelus australis]|uniref:Uncharacterized protein n=1 Tax=Dryococelus australis TaxID=614101 RepID=A0ABQ9GDH0_9NEOP|nr:hypothetical protein PR048_029466 [Dryococelus australis]
MQDAEQRDTPLSIIHGFRERVVTWQPHGWGEEGLAIVYVTQGFCYPPPQTAIRTSNGSCFHPSILLKGNGGEDDEIGGRPTAAEARRKRPRGLPPLAADLNAAALECVYATNSCCGTLAAGGSARGGSCDHGQDAGATVQTWQHHALIGQSSVEEQSFEKMLVVGTPTDSLVHPVFDASWRTVARSSPSTATADNQCTVDVGASAHTIIPSATSELKFCRVGEHPGANPRPPGYRSATLPLSYGTNVTSDDAGNLFNRYTANIGQLVRIIIDFICLIISKLFWKLLVSSYILRDRGGVVVRLPASQGELIFACEDRAGRCCWSAFFLGDPRFPRPFIPALLRTHLALPTSALKTSRLSTLVSLSALWSRLSSPLVGRPVSSFHVKLFYIHSGDRVRYYLVFMPLSRLQHFWSPEPVRCVGT